MMNYAFKLLLLALCCVFASASEYGGNKIYKAKALMDVSWTSTKGTVLKTTELFKFENAASFFLHKLLEDEEHTGLLPNEHVLSTHVNVVSQSKTTPADDADGESIFVIKTQVQILYSSDEYRLDMASILQQVTTAHQGSGLLGLLADIQVLDPAIMSLVLSFSDSGDDTILVYRLPSEYVVNTAQGKSGAEKGLIVAVVFLVLMLVFISFVLLWITGGCLVVKSMIPYYVVEGVEKAYDRTVQVAQDVMGIEKDDDTATTASGVLGANPSQDSGDNMPNGFTPTRGVYSNKEHDLEEADSNASIFSPLSNLTNMTTSDKPLGIASLRKLTRFNTPNVSPPLRREQKLAGGAIDNSSDLRISKLSYDQHNLQQHRSSDE